MRETKNRSSTFRRQRPLQRLDIVCDQFEERWLADDPPQIAEYLEQVSREEQGRLFIELLKLDLDYRHQRQEHPKEETLVEKFPEFRTEIMQVLTGQPSWTKIDDAHLAQTQPHVEASDTPKRMRGNLPSGSHFAGYELLNEIARGGMGVVFRARQIEADRIVALKMILSGSLAGHDEIERFKTEAKAAASLDHPNIVPIFDVGEFEEHHYFSMGYVDGPSLKQFLSEGMPGVRKSAALVDTMAQAIDYAHSKGVIHRDLKPANILLDKKDSPRITDFGLSKVLDSQTELTGTGQLLGTPAYMSPEQVSGVSSRIGPLTDVYSLGAILYELTTGQVPFRAESTIQMLDQVSSETPSPLRLVNPHIDADIETICLKCLEKDPADRYASARALSEDLGRYLRGEPIVARRIRPAQKFVRWCKRRPIIAGLSASLMASLLAFGSSTIYFAVTSRIRGSMVEVERQQKDYNLEMAQAAVDEMVDQAELLADVPKTESQRIELLEKATSFYRQFLRQRPDDSDVRHQAARVHHSMGEVFRLLDQFDASKKAYGESIAILRDLSSADSEAVRHKQRLRESYIWLGVLLNTVEPENALNFTDRAVQIQESIAAGISDPSGADFGMARALYNRGLMLSERGATDAAEADYQKAITLLRNLLESGASVGVYDYRLDLGRTLNNYGNHLKKRKRVDEAKEMISEAISLHAGRNLDREERQDLATFRNNLSNTLASLGDIENATKENQRAIDLLEALAKQFPRYGTIKSELANAWNSCGALAGRTRKLDEAGEAFARAETPLQALVDDYPDQASYVHRLGNSRYNRGVVAYMQKDYEVTTKLLNEAIELHLRSHASNPKNEEFSRSLKNDYSLAIKSLQVTQDVDAIVQTTVDFVSAFPRDSKLRRQAAQWLAQGYKIASARVAEHSSSRVESIGKRAVEELESALRMGEPQASLFEDGQVAEAFLPLQDREDFRELLDGLPSDEL